MHKYLYIIYFIFFSLSLSAQNFVPLDFLRKLPKYIIEDNLPIRLYSYPYSTKIDDVECNTNNRDSIHYEYHLGDAIQPVNRFDVRRLIVSQHPLKGSTINFSEFPNLQHVIFISYGCELTMKEIQDLKNIEILELGSDFHNYSTFIHSKYVRNILFIHNSIEHFTNLKELHLSVYGASQILSTKKVFSLAKLEVLTSEYYDEFFSLHYVLNSSKIKKGYLFLHPTRDNKYYYDENSFCANKLTPSFFAISPFSNCKNACKQIDDNWWQPYCSWSYSHYKYWDNKLYDDCETNGINRSWDETDTISRSKGKDKFPYNGEFILRDFDDSTHILGRGKMVNGQPDGNWFFENKDQTEIETRNYKNGVEDGVWIYKKMDENIRLRDYQITELKRKGYEFHPENNKPFYDAMKVIYKDGNIVSFEKQYGFQIKKEDQPKYTIIEEEIEKFEPYRKKPLYIIEDTLPIRLYCHQLAERIQGAPNEHYYDSQYYYNRFDVDNNDVSRLILIQSPISKIQVDFSLYPNLKELVFVSINRSLSQNDFNYLSKLEILELKDHHEIYNTKKTYSRDVNIYYDINTPLKNFYKRHEKKYINTMIQNYISIHNNIEKFSQLKKLIVDIEFGNLLFTKSVFDLPSLNVINNIQSLDYFLSPYFALKGKQFSLESSINIDDRNNSFISNSYLIEENNDDRNNSFVTKSYILGGCNESSLIPTQTTSLDVLSPSYNCKNNMNENWGNYFFNENSDEFLTHFSLWNNKVFEDCNDIGLMSQTNWKNYDSVYLSKGKDKFPLNGKFTFKNICEGNFKDGLPDGKWIFTGESETIEERYYTNGVEDSVWRIITIDHTKKYTEEEHNEPQYKNIEWFKELDPKTNQIFYKQYVPVFYVRYKNGDIVDIDFMRTK
jgi:hypothetical protein